MTQLTDRPTFSRQFSLSDQQVALELLDLTSLQVPSDDFDVSLLTSVQSEHDTTTLVTLNGLSDYWKKWAT